jgi:uncharacterized MAPEG superfamily protein
MALARLLGIWEDGSKKPWGRNARANMTTELGWLMLTAILAASLWIPYIVGVNVTKFEGKEAIFDRPPDLGKMPAWVHRSHRAQLNLIEQFVPFATIVLIAAILRISTAATQWCVILFFWIRLAHAIGYISGKARFPVRPLIYLAGWVDTLVLAWTVAVNAR